MDSEQAILGELRRLSRSQEELALQLRIDTPWVRLRDHVSYGVTVVQQVPLLARVCFFFGVLALTFGALGRSARAAFIGLDLLCLSLVFVGTTTS